MFSIVHISEGILCALEVYVHKETELLMRIRVRRAFCKVHVQRSAQKNRNFGHVPVRILTPLQ